MALGHVVEGEHGPGRLAFGAGERHPDHRVGAAPAEHLDLVHPAGPRAQDLLQQLADLALPDHLQVMAADRLPQLEAAAQRLVGEEHDPAMVDGHDAVLHRGEDGVDARPVAGDLGDAVLQLVGRPVEDPGQLADLVGAAHRAAGRKVAGREAPRGVHHLTERPRQRRREGGGKERDQREGQGEGDGHRPLQVVDLLLHAAERERDARDADDAGPMLDGHRGVEQVVAHGRAVADGAARAHLQGLLDLGPVQMVLHRAQRVPGQRGVRDHRPVGGDDRHPGLDVAGRLVDDGVDLVGRPALGERLRDHPRHQPRLGEQPPAHLLDRAPMQVGPLEREHDHEGGRRRRDGGDRDAAPQPQRHCGSSLSR